MRLSFNLMPMIIDAHEDLAWNIVNLQRDYTRSAYEIREDEKESAIPDFNGNTLLGWPQFQEAQVAIIFGTIYCLPKRLDQGKYPVQTYQNHQEAHHCYRENLDVYRRLTDQHPDKFRLLLNLPELYAHLGEWESYLENHHKPGPPVGIVILMENAEGIRTPAEVEQWYEWGVRLIGPAWAGNQYCGGTHEPGPLTEAGYALLNHMAEFNLVLDLSHMDHQSARQALDAYPGPIIASHSNPEALIRGITTNRHLKDDTIQQLIERGGVMGIVLLNSFLEADWRERGSREIINLDHITHHIDYVCQLAGNSHHVALGTDFDGGFGVESVPTEIDTIADLTKLGPKLAEKGYNEEDINRIFSGNWLRILKQSLPQS